MARKKKADRDEAPAEPTSTGEITQARSAALEAAAQDEKLENWANKPDSDAYSEAVKILPKIIKCYENKQDQNDSIDECWNIFNAEIDANQQYVGNSSCYVPEVRNCIKARAKRTLKQLFPNNRKHVDAVGNDNKPPYPLLALLEHYIRVTKLKTIVKAILIAGDVTGQWNVYVDWLSTRRSIKRVIRQPRIVQTLDPDNAPEGFDDVELPDEHEEKLVEEELQTELPEIVPFATEDLAVYPPTVDDIELSKASSIRLRMSQDMVQEMIDDGVFVGIEASKLVDKLAPDKSKERGNAAKRAANQAGIRTEGTWKYALVYWIQMNLPLDGKGKKQAAYAYFAGESVCLGIIRNPIWSGKRPIISAPIEKQEGSFFGISMVKPVKYMQWNLTDFWNMGQDSAQYGLLPVIMTDPLQNPNWAAMVMGLAAVWPIDPTKTKALEFPQLWKDAGQMCQMLQALIRESMDVNDSMMGRAPPGRKNAQQIAAVQQDQQISITDHAENFEETILNPLMERVFELDQQFRTRDLTVINKGDVGIRARMMDLPPQQFDQRYFFWWAGTSYIVGMQRMQQQIAWMNVLRGVPPQQLNGRKLDITPILEAGTEAIFGPEIAPRILIDTRDLMTIDPEEENSMLHNGFDVETHPEDDDPKHIASHQRTAVRTGDLNGKIRIHILKHAAQLQAKRQQEMAQMQQAGGGPGGQKPPGLIGAPGGAGPGMAGTPRPGAQPGQPRLQGPPGAVHPDGMLDPMAMMRG